MAETSKKSLLTRRLSFYTLLALFLLIFVGGLVRSLGAGMGCPDWPKCFDQWVPPSSAAELPEGYEQDYVDRRLAKNERLGEMLSSLGYSDLARKVVDDPAARESHPFDAFQTWVEYLNRLMGAVVGLLVLLTLASTLRPFDGKSFAIGMAALLLTLFQGWLGSLVVSTNLLPWMVTVHMLFALVIVACFSLLVLRHSPLKRGDLDSGLRSKALLATCLVLVTATIQIGLGTQIREEVDIALDQGLTKAAAVDSLGLSFSVHKTLSWLVLAALVFLAFWLFPLKEKATGVAYSSLLAAISGVLALVAGLGLAGYALPAFLQPIHLLTGSLIFGTLWFLLLFLFRTNKLT